MKFEKVPFLVSTDYNPDPKSKISFIADCTDSIPIMINTGNFYIEEGPNCVCKIISQGREIVLDKEAFFTYLEENEYDQMLLILVTGTLDVIISGQSYNGDYFALLPGKNFSQKRSISTNWRFEVLAEEIILIPSELWVKEWKELNKLNKARKKCFFRN